MEERDKKRINPVPSPRYDEIFHRGCIELFEDRPVIVCLCGSTRFSKAFHDANLKETLAGRIVLSIGCDMRSDTEIFTDKSEEELKEIKTELAILHLRKIDLADEVLVLNVGGYIGESTKREIDYAENKGKSVYYLEELKDSKYGEV